MLSNSAFNALLKTLEEPPPHVKFIFATTDPHKLPATVQSRCQRYDFRRIPLGLIVERLRTIADEQKLEVSDKVLFTLAREGEGSMRDAQSLLDQITAGAEGVVSDEDALAALGIADRSVVYEIGDAIIERNPTRALEALDNVHRLGCDMRRLTRDLLEHFRNLTVTHVTGGKLLPDLPDGEVETLREQARAFEAADADRCFRLLLQSDEEVGRSAYPKLVLEMAVLRLATLEPLVPVADLLRRLESLDGRAAGRPGGDAQSAAAPRRREQPAKRSPRGGAPSAAASVAPVAPPVSVPGAGLGGAEAWPGLLAFVQQKSPALGSHLATCTRAELGDKVLELEAPEGFRANYLKDLAHVAAIEELAAEFLRAQRTGDGSRGRPRSRLLQRVSPSRARPSERIRSCSTRP